MIDSKFTGNRIKALRLEEGLTQSEFAEHLCISSQAVSNWERGATYPDLDNIVRIADLFGVTVDELIRPKREGLMLGVDGGGTKTEFAVISPDGSILMHTVKGGCNPNDVGYQRSFSILREEIDKILSEYQSIEAMFLGIAGITVGNHATRLYYDLKKCYHNTKIQIQSDVFNLFAMCDNADMAVISGTGSVVFVKNGSEYQRIGGWGYLLDDAGSAYDIGRAAIRTALYEEDMKKSPSRLSYILRNKLNVKSVWEHLNTIYSEGKPYIAELAPVVFEAYRKHDEEAERIIDDNAKALASLLNAGVELYGAEPVAVASGGLFTHYTDIMRKHIEKYSDIKLITDILPPIYGACKSAYLMVNSDIPSDFYDNFKNTYRGSRK
jgi:N-acetylglucosamine kinase-like BadF-type ATPase